MTQTVSNSSPYYYAPVTFETAGAVSLGTQTVTATAAASTPDSNPTTRGIRVYAYASFATTSSG